jgi:imidazoleglycerol-phosphate dehydratase / histidinol-phosphatase
MQKILFLDRDGVLINEPADDPQIDSLEKVTFIPGIFTNLQAIASKLDFIFVMVTNQDGLGTASFPESTFWPAQNLILNTLEGEGIKFEEICIDRHFESDKSPNRKPGIGMLKKYLDSQKYDLANSYVVGDRNTDMMLARNLGCKGIRINAKQILPEQLTSTVVLDTNSWATIKSYLFKEDRKAVAIRDTSETKIKGSINIDGSGITHIKTGLGFFDHMLDQIAKHASIDLFLETNGDLEIDEHHTVEDTAILLGSLFASALGKKAGIKRYGFALPMDEAAAQVLLDFGGRPWLVWDVKFTREYVGDVPTEMFYHFFKSWSDHAKANLNIKANADNDHHLIESVFKAFAKAIKAAKSRDEMMEIPSTKGIL